MFRIILVFFIIIWHSSLCAFEKGVYDYKTHWIYSGDSVTVSWDPVSSAIEYEVIAVHLETDAQEISLSRQCMGSRTACVAERFNELKKRGFPVKEVWDLREDFKKEDENQSRKSGAIIVGGQQTNCCVHIRANILQRRNPDCRVIVHQALSSEHYCS